MSQILFLVLYDMENKTFSNNPSFYSNNDWTRMQIIGHLNKKKSSENRVECSALMDYKPTEAKQFLSNL